MITVGPQQTGKPPQRGVYRVRYLFRANEHFAWFDGESWSVPYGNAHEAEVDNRGMARLRLGMRSWRPVTSWRAYYDDGQAMVDALRKAFEGQ